MSGLKKPGDICDTPGCGKPHVARGKCRTCYVAWYRATPKDQRTPALGFSRLTIEERFWLKVDRSGGPDACWPWKPPKDRNGYGVFHVSTDRGKVPAQTFAVELATSEPCPPGKEGCHRCDNPPCCNPAHIYYGTRQQNVNDRCERGRSRIGSGHPDALLTEAGVIVIRQSYAAGELARVLAVEFNVTEGCIHDAVTGVTWKHVGGPITTRYRTKRRSLQEV